MLRGTSLVGHRAFVRLDGEDYDPAIREAAARRELARVFDACGSCHACIDTCGVFPRLFVALEGLPGGAADMTPDAQDEFVSDCTDCGRCLHDCPYGPGRDDRSINLPGAARAIRRARRDAERSPMAVLAALLGGWGARLLRAAREGRVRDVVRWRSRRSVGDADVVLLDTCGLARRPGLAAAFVALVTRSGGRGAVVSPSACCGAPLLAVGETAAFARVARRVVAGLAPLVRGGATVAVAEPSCLRTIAIEYPAAVDSDDARFVAGRVVDACEPIELGDHGAVGRHVYLAPCHVHPREGEPAGALLLRKIGFEVEVVRGCAPGGPGQAATVGECEHAGSLPHPILLLDADWGRPPVGS